MKNEKLGSESAFPLSIAATNNEWRDISEYSSKDVGMSKRLYIATKAMQGMLANTIVATELGKNEVPHQNQIEGIARASVKYADELLKREALS